ncbi:MAG: TolC family protein [Bacteroidota bacterium]
MRQVKVLVLFMVAIAISPLVKAQTDTVAKVHQVTAQEAVDMALKQRTEILNAQLDLRNQGALNSEITGQALPQVKGNANLMHYFNIPVTVLPDFISPSVYGVLEKEGVQDGSGNPIKVPSAFATFPAQFGTPWQASLGFSVQQLLFQPDVFVGLKARNTALELYENQLKIQQDSVKSNVYRSYYGVLIAEKGLSFAKESELRLAKLFNDQEQLFKNGFIERLDIDKTQVTLNNVRTTILQLQNLVDVSLAGLKFAMAIPQKDKLLLSDTLSNEEIKKDVFDLANDFKYENRSEVQTLNSSNKLLSYQVKRYQLGAIPTVAAIWNVNKSAQRAEFDIFDFNEKWFLSNSVGLNISIPIFDGNQRRNKIKQAQFSLEKNRNSLKQFEQLVDFQIVASRTQLVNSISALNSQEENKALAEKVYNTTKLKYEKGLGSSFEVLQSETSLQDALNNYYQAIYNAIIAKIGYRRALGKL